MRRLRGRATTTRPCRALRRRRAVASFDLAGAHASGWRAEGRGGEVTPKAARSLKRGGGNGQFWTPAAPWPSRRGRLEPSVAAAAGPPWRGRPQLLLRQGTRQPPAAAPRGASRAGPARSWATAAAGQHHPRIPRGSFSPRKVPGQFPVPGRPPPPRKAPGKFRESLRRSLEKEVRKRSRQKEVRKKKCAK